MTKRTEHFVSHNVRSPAPDRGLGFAHPPQHNLCLLQKLRAHPRAQWFPMPRNPWAQHRLRGTNSHQELVLRRHTHSWLTLLETTHPHCGLSHEEWGQVESVAFSVEQRPGSGGDIQESNFSAAQNSS